MQWIVAFVRRRGWWLWWMVLIAFLLGGLVLILMARGDQGTPAAAISTSAPTTSYHTIGLPVDVPPFSITITSAMLQPASDASHVYLVLALTFQNEDSQPQFANTFGFDLTSEAGNHYHKAILSTLMDPSGDLPPGAKSSGQIAYLVLSSDHMFLLVLRLHATSAPVYWTISV